MSSVSVVIPNYNGRQLFERFLPSVQTALRHPSVDASEIIVSDDGSTDESIAFLQEQYPDIIIIESRENTGFAPTVNRGVAFAKMDYILLLNTDMELMPDTIGVLVSRMREDLFGVSCAICAPDDGHIQEGLKRPSVRGCKLGYTDDLSEEIEGETMYLCGGIALIERSKLQILGGLDNRDAPFYFEDMDLSLRAKQHGWISWYTSSTRVIHQHSATIGSHFSRDEVKAIFVRNRVLISWRFLPSKRMRIVCNALFHSAKEILGRATYRPYSDALKRLMSDR